MGLGTLTPAPGDGHSGMVKWLGDLDEDELRRLDDLLGELLTARPAGWSVVRRDLNELSLRPPDRTIGKFSVVPHNDELHVAFHSRTKGVWADRATFSSDPGVGARILEWAQRVVTEWS